MSAALIEASFPQLAQDGYRITSTETSVYNCFAWGLSNTQKWWSPVQNGGYHWPAGVKQDLKLETFVRLYAQEGNFHPCDHHAHELTYDKLAIYCNQQGEVTHVARQLASGKWTSKLGDWEDIEHKTLAGIEGQFYGKVAKVLKRKL